MSALLLTPNDESEENWSDVTLVQVCEALLRSLFWKPAVSYPKLVGISYRTGTPRHRLGKTSLWLLKGGDINIYSMPTMC